MLPILVVIYSSLILKGVVSCIRSDRWIPALSRGVGRLEYAISPWRDYLFCYILGCFGIYQIVNKNYKLAGLYLFLCGYSQLNQWSRKKLRIAFCRWILRQPSIHPRQFFKIYYLLLGSFSNPFIPSLQADPAPSHYKTGSPPKKTFWPLLKGCLDTASLAKLAILGMKHFNSFEGVQIFDALARLWGSCFLYHARSSLNTLGIESLPSLKGKTLLVFNHKSYLDFALTFFALRDLRKQQRFLRPRFIAAKDHFIDNPILYSWLGLGRCIEQAGMVFVDRRKGKGWLAMQEASDRLVTQEVEVAVYPQGTRANPWMNKKTREDAGYYTTFARKDWDKKEGHLKKGTAQLILDTALKLQGRGESPLQVLFIGIEGTAIAGPKGSFRIQTECEIDFRLGTCWEVNLSSDQRHATPGRAMDPNSAASCGVLTGNLVPGGDKNYENPHKNPPTTEAHLNYLKLLEEFQQKIDQELVQALNHREKLIQKIVKDISFSEGDREEKKTQLYECLTKIKDKGGKLPFIILDRIYTLPSSHQKNYLEEWIQLVLDSSDFTKLQELNRRVSLELFS